MAATLPAFYYPSTIGWVDDNQLFLNTITEIFNTNHSIRTFSNIVNCLSYFSTYIPHSQNMPILRDCIEHDYNDTTNHALVDIDVTLLNQVHHDETRIHEMSVLIVDYQMPEMNGIELCRRLSHIPCKKILLTGEANNNAAIAAFNEKMIDCFIRKDSKTLHEDLQKHINRLIQDYFRERTQHVIAHMEVSHPLPLSDPIFVEFFKQIREAHHITEYSLIDKNGSLLMLNKNGHAACLVIHTDKSLDTFTNTYESCHGTASAVNAVHTRSKIPFFGIGTEASEYGVDTWHQYLHTPAVLEGRERYYWVVITNDAPNKFGEI